MNTGWVSIHRKLFKHWTYKDKPFNKSMAWIDILLSCNHSDNKVNIKNELILCKRGESLNCLNTWATRWGWDKSKVRRFLKLLENDTMIELIPTPKTTHIRVINYDTYQVNRNADETQMKRIRNADETQMTLNNNDNTDLIMSDNEKIKESVFSTHIPDYLNTDEFKDALYMYALKRKQDSFDNNLWFEDTVNRTDRLCENSVDKAIEMLHNAREGSWKMVYPLDNGKHKPEKKVDFRDQKEVFEL